MGVLCCTVCAAAAAAAGKNWQQSEAAHEARVAVELGLRPGVGGGGLTVCVEQTG